MKGFLFLKWVTMTQGGGGGGGGGGFKGGIESKGWRCSGVMGIIMSDVRHHISDCDRGGR